MSTLYLIDQGAKLKKVSERLVVEKDTRVLLEVPAFKVDRILIYGNITITTPVMVFLLENGIDTSFLSIYGRYRGRLLPKDPVNSLLSFSYTLLTNEINSLLYALGFDPYVGYLHGINYGRPSLALDLVEEFRHLGERFTLNLINNGMIKQVDFEKREKGFYLKEDARRTFFSHYEKRMLKSFYYWKLGRKVTYRELFRIQAQSLARIIQSGGIYEPFQAIG